ncbi:MAG: ribose-phosphate pyrophosphokinase [Clostridiales bacterium]|nr:ribose-phosphate pyrophosphokinase [Clostridiales bacterium]
MNGTLQLFAGTAHRQLAQKVAEYVNTPLGQVELGRFSDGEVSVSIRESVRGHDVFVVQPTCPPVNENLMELLILMDALKRASAARINAVIPYYGYARQDRKVRARDPITAKLVADLLQVAGAHRVVTVDLHAGQIQGFFNVPVDHLTAVPLIAEYLLSRGLEDPVVVSPDAGGAIRARELSNRLDADLAIIDKRREKANRVEAMTLIGEVAGRDAILIDDLIDTAGTMTMGAALLKERGARRVFACGTHPLFSGPAVERLSKAPIEEIVVTDTIPLSPEAAALPHLKVLSVAPLIGEAILRIHQHLSVSKLFT